MKFEPRIITAAPETATALVRDVGALEEKGVLRSRWPFWRAWREKEWFFSCLHDPQAGVYCSWTFARTFYAETFRFWLCDLRTDRSWHLDRRILFDRQQTPGHLDLRWAKRGALIEYQGAGDEAAFSMRDERFRVDLELVRRWPSFVRRENQFVCDYTLLHDFGNEVRGAIEVEGERFAVDTRRCYTDHCFGRVPSRTGWHWLAVQDEQLALASLVNYGPYAQRYTQMFAGGEWVRLAPDVNFDYDPRRPLEPWRVTSVDLDLVARPVRLHPDRVRVPPFVDIRHDELHVEVEGRVRVEGRWRAVGGLTGVMESHHGRW